MAHSEPRSSFKASYYRNLIPESQTIHEDSTVSLISKPGTKCRRLQVDNRCLSPSTAKGTLETTCTVITFQTTRCTPMYTPGADGRLQAILHYTLQAQLSTGAVYLPFLLYFLLAYIRTPHGLVLASCVRHESRCAPPLPSTRHDNDCVDLDLQLQDRARVVESSYTVQRSYTRKV